MEHIDKFISKVRTRLNRHLGLTVLICSIAAGGAAATVIALFYIIQGYHVPLVWYPLVFAVSLFAGLCSWYFLRRSRFQAARFLDNHFALKDSVRSYSGFHKSGKDTGFYALQAKQTDGEISHVSVKSIRYKCPAYLIALAVVLVLTSTLMGFKDDSPSVIQKRQREQFVLESTQAINLEINEITEQLKEELEDKKLDEVVDMNNLRQQVDELKETSDIKDAMRQYAQLEKEVGDVLSKLSQRQTEELLERMGQELQKDDATKALGNQLTQKDYKSAAKETEEFKIDPKALKELQQSQIEKLKEMAARMAEEAARSQPGTGQQSTTGQNQGNQQNSQTQQGKQSTASRLAQMTQKLNQSAQQLGQAMQQAMQNGQGQQANGQLQQMTQNANQNLGNMGQFLQQMAARQQAQAMMQGMLSSLAQSQIGLGNMGQNGMGQNGMGQNGQNGMGQNGMGQAPGNGTNPGGNSPNPGGLNAGYGSSNAKNNQPGKDAPAGQITQLQGTQGTGTSLTSNEESASGGGSSVGTLEREHEEYMRQVESFVRREDVPEAVKAGVKAYFENIHNIDEGN